jgi:hypothetical protein
MVVTNHRQKSGDVNFRRCLRGFFAARGSVGNAARAVGSAGADSKSNLWAGEAAKRSRFGANKAFFNSVICSWAVSSASCCAAMVARCSTMNWSQLVDQIGVPPKSALFVHVCDRAADNFEVYCHLLLTRQDWVIRAAHLNRMIVYHETEMALNECLKRLPVSGTYELSWRTPTDGKRTAKVEIRLGMIMMMSSTRRTLTPARYISTNASSTLLSRRR